MIGEYEEAISKYYSSNGDVDTDGEGGIVEDYYWYEENSDGGITILGPKKLKYINQEKAGAEMQKIMTEEFGEETINAYIQDTIDEETREIIIERSNEILFEIIKTKSQDDEYWITLETTKDMVGVKDGLDYDIVISYDISKGIPEYIDNKPVTTIGTYAFNHVFVFKSDFIPNTVKNIEEGAFYKSCFDTQLIIPNSVERIGYRAFRRMENHGEVTLIMEDAQNKLISIGEEAFEESNLTGTLNLRSAITIESDAFSKTDVIINRK